MTWRPSLFFYSHSIWFPQTSHNLLTRLRSWLFYNCHSLTRSRCTTTCNQSEVVSITLNLVLLLRAKLRGVQEEQRRAQYPVLRHSQYHVNQCALTTIHQDILCLMREKETVSEQTVRNNQCPHSRAWGEFRDDWLC